MIIREDDYVTPGERIKVLRTKNDISQKKLSHDLGYKTYTTISKWESDASLPPGKELKNLATYFQVSTDYILGLDDQPTNTYEQHESQEILYIKSLNTFTDSDEKKRTIKVPNYIIKESNINYYVLNVYTDAINRVIPNGNKIVILDFTKSKEQHLKTGDILLIKRNNDYSLKYYRKTDTKIYLEPYSYLDGFNTDEYSIEGFKQIDILGKVIYTFRNFN